MHRHSQGVCVALLLLLVRHAHPGAALEHHERPIRRVWIHCIEDSQHESVALHDHAVTLVINRAGEMARKAQ